MKDTIKLKYIGATATPKGTMLHLYEMMGAEEQLGIVMDRLPHHTKIVENKTVYVGNRYLGKNPSMNVHERTELIYHGITINYTL